VSDPKPGRFAGKSVYVTGGTGFIGSYVVDALVAEGARVTALARPSARAKALAAKGVAVHEGNVTDPSTIRPEGHDFVIHGAAWVGFGIPEKKRDLFRRTNVDGTRHVLDAARRAGVARAVHVSSVAALGRADGVMTEETKTARPPISLYEATKREAHAIALEYTDLGIALPMPSLVVGAGSDFDPLLKRAARGGFPALVKGDATKGWVHVRDTAEGIILALLKGSGPYLLSSDHMPASEFFSRFIEAAGRKPPKARIAVGTLQGAGRAVEKAFNLFGKTPPFSGELLDALDVPMVYDSSRAKRDLGWAPDLWGRVSEDLEGRRWS
jgi:dihydroflavonol-4-reductase